MTNPQTWGMAGGMMPPVQQPVNQQGDCTRRDLVFFVLFLVESFLLIRTGVFQGFHFGFAVSWILLVFLSILYLFRHGISGKAIGRAPVFTLFLFAFLFGSAPVFALWEDPGIFFFLILEMILCFFLFLSFLAGTAKDRSGGLLTLWDGIRTALLPVHKLIYPFKALATSSPMRRQGKTILLVFLGLLAAVPVLLTVVPLLISADAAFEGLVKELFSSLLTIIGQIILCCLLYPVLLSRQYALRYGLETAPWQKNNGAGMKKEPEEWGLVPQAFVLAFLIPLSICYIVYLFSQLAYFFSAFSGILPEGFMGEDGIFPVAEYARRGFFEMAAVAAVNALVISAVLLLVKKKDASLPAGVKILGQFICLFTMVLIGTAMAKMGMYISMLGYTRLRILTSLFMIILFLGFLFLSLRLWIRRFPYIRLLICAACLVTLTAAYMNVDRWTAEKNVEAYLDGRLESVDVEHLSKLQTSALPALEKLTEDEDAGPYAKAAMIRMFYRQRGLDEEGNVRPLEKRKLFAMTRQKKAEEETLQRWEKECLSYAKYFGMDYHYDENGQFWYWHDDNGEWITERVEELSLKPYEPEPEENP